jgi:hypothetical protein
VGEVLKGYEDDYFYLAEDGGQIFMDPATGITTSGSQHCRTELREQTPGAGSAAWASTGTNTMTVGQGAQARQWQRGGCPALQRYRFHPVD